MSDTGRDATEDDAAHLEDVPDGLGCAEVWEELSERRGEGTENGDPADRGDADLDDHADLDGLADDDTEDDGSGSSTAERVGDGQGATGRG
jgi:hypothetical protein